MLEELVVTFTKIIQARFAILCGQEAVLGTLSIAGEQITAIAAFARK